MYLRNSQTFKILIRIVLNSFYRLDNNNLMNLKNKNVSHKYKQNV